MWFVEQLLTDPSSHLLTVLVGNEYPVTREWVALANVWDLLAEVNTPQGKKAPKYPRPMPTESRARKGRTSLNPADARAKLAQVAGRG